MGGSDGGDLVFGLATMAALAVPQQLLSTNEAFLQKQRRKGEGVRR